MNQMYGYIRVSTREQNEARQLAAMAAFGVDEEHIVVEKLSGKDFRRPRYQALVEQLQPGDVLVVKSLDRLGRNYGEILEQWAYLTKTRGAAIVVLDMPLLDTREGRDLTGRLIADIVLQLLSYVAETERQNIRQRQAEGIAAARARGIKFGRRPIELPTSFHQLACLGSRGRSPPGTPPGSWGSPTRPSCAGPRPAQGSALKKTGPPFRTPAAARGHCAKQRKNTTGVSAFPLRPRLIFCHAQRPILFQKAYFLAQFDKV